MAERGASVGRMSIRTWVTIAMAVAMAGLAAVAGCVGDSSVGSDGGPDSSLPDVGSDTFVSDAGADSCAKVCDGACVSPTDPTYGCSTTSCTACPPLAHVTTAACSNGACAIGTCDPAYDDLDKDASDGCETPNPLAFQPSSLRLWLKADDVTVGDGGVVSWPNLAPSADGGVGATLATGHPIVDGANWPALPGMQSVSFTSGDSMNVDLSGMAGGLYTTFVASARLSDATNCVLGSNGHPAGNPNCPTQAGAAFQMCYLGSPTDTFTAEVYCNNLQLSVTANTSSGYQSAILASWWDGSLNWDSVDSSSRSDTTEDPAALNASLAPGILGGGYGGPAYSGLVGEVIVYATNLSAPDHAAVQSYLKTKWKTP